MREGALLCEVRRALHYPYVALRQRLAPQRSLRLRRRALAKELGSVRAFVVFVMTPLGSTYMDYRPRNHIIRHGC